MAARTYGLYCYKFIEAMNGDIYRIQFHRENYTGEAFEIDKMGVTPFTINIDGQGEALTRPIVKSSLSIQIIDTEQFDYSTFYTASAFEWKIDVACVNAGQRFVWVGFLTPDSFQQACVKGATISLTARDNLGYLDEVDFDGVEFISSTDLGDNIVSVWDFIYSALAVSGREDANYDFEIKAQTSGVYNSSSTPLADLCINTLRFRENTWGEALTMVLKSFGWQLRPAFISGYTDEGEELFGSTKMRYEIVDVAFLGNEDMWNAMQTPMFLRNSKQMSIRPNWRELKIEQDYGVIENFFPMPTEKDYTNEGYGLLFQSYRRYMATHEAYDLTPEIDTTYEPERWTYPFYQLFNTANDQNIYALNARKYGNGIFANSFILSSLTREFVDHPRFSFPFYGDDMVGSTFRVDLRLHQQLYALRNINIEEGTSALNPTPVADLVLIPDSAEYNRVVCHLDMDITVTTDSGNVFVCTPSGWNTYDPSGDPNISFEFVSQHRGKSTTIAQTEDSHSFVNDVTFVTDSAERPMIEFSITAANTPSGRVEIIFYRPRYEVQQYQMWSSDLVAFVFDNITASFDVSAPKKQTLRIMNSTEANIKQTMSTEFGSIPANAGGALAFAGGIYGSNNWRLPYRAFARNANEEANNTLSLLVAKGLMHHHQKAQRVYTGTITYDRPYFDALLRIDGKSCLINAATYDVLRNQMTGEFIEVEPFDDSDDIYEAFTVTEGDFALADGSAFDVLKK